MKLCFKRIKKILRSFLLSALFLHAGTQSYYWLNHFYHWNMPSVQRIEFERKFGFPILGWGEDIEGNPQNLSLILEVIEEERKTKSFGLNSIRIRSSNYLKKPVWDQAIELFSSGNSGYCINGRIVIDRTNLASTLHHEIKHAKIRELIEAQPEFLEKWERLAVRDNGETLYLSNKESFCARINFLDALVDENKKNFAENVKLGFVSSYARINVHEDIAELCALAETNPWQFNSWLFGTTEERRERIREKVVLAQEYRLMPPEFSEFVNLEILFMRSFNAKAFCANGAKEFLEASADFLKNHPRTVYESRGRQSRASILYSGYKSQAAGYTLDEVIEEYELLLSSGYKDTSTYLPALGSLSRIYKDEKGDLANAERFSRLYAEYAQRYNNGN